MPSTGTPSRKTRLGAHGDPSWTAEADRPDYVVGDIERPNRRVGAGVAHAPRDDARVPAAKVDDQNPVRSHPWCHAGKIFRAHRFDKRAGS
uniref:Uncharacterized protein n=1 Tax=Marseillevirus LCMAC103 TaxID=2506604 RepID=A0A481YWI7_9VIRU|nr:MAG: hypothetical protein LCMAC103_02620 [Marseillevirus LCMAC103]